jgi:hypothetical protein
VGLPTGRPPYTLVAFASFAASNVLIAVVWEGLSQRLVGGALVLVLATYGLLRGVWLSWAFLTAVAAGNAIVAFFQWPAWPQATYIALINGVMLALLLNRPSWRHVRRGRPRLLARLG